MSALDNAGSTVVFQSGNGAELLVEALVRHGVSTIFGVPGDTGVALYDALYHRTEEIEHVLARDERHAAAMADAYARSSNAVGVVEVSSGGGVSYVVGGLGEAYAASVPVLVITSDIHDTSHNSGAMTDIDQVALFSAVTKWRGVVQKASDIPDMVADALRAATSGRPGPVAIILPENILDDPVGGIIMPQATPARLASVPRTVAETELVHRAVDMIHDAERPVIVAGSGVHMSAAWTPLAELAEWAGIPVATTIQGKGAIAETSAWALGTVGQNGAREYANDYVAGSDAVILVGTRGNATDTNSWAGPRRDSSGVIAINITDYPNANNFPNGIMLVGDAAGTLRHIRLLIPAASKSSLTELKSTLATMRDAWELPGPTNSEVVATGLLDPRHVIQTIHKVLVDDCTVVADPGTPTPNIASFWEIREPGRSVLMPRGHGPMGYAIPAAVGIAFANPQKPVVSITADGSFAMACGELETVARFDLPIVYVQLTNRSLGWIKMLQHLYLDGRYFGVDPGPIDAPAVARACGVRGLKATSLSHLEDELQSFKRDPHPLYIDIDVPTLMDSTPPVAPWQAALAGDSSRPVY